MASKVQFTEARVQGLVCPATAAYELWWDAGCPHLGVRITAAGARSYVFQGRIHGKALRVTIGDVRSWPLAKARTEARRMVTLVDRGIDPRDEAEQQRVQAESQRAEERRRDVLVSDVWQTYIAANKSNWGERHYKDHVSLGHAGGAKKRRGKGKTKPGPLASLMPLKLSEVTSDRVAKWLERESKARPTNTAQAYRLLRAFIRWAADVPDYKGAIPADAYSARAVRALVPTSHAKEGDCLQREQLPAWFNAVRGRSNLVISAYLQALLLTGARREELAALRWDDVDFKWNSLTIRDKVKGKGLTVKQREQNKGNREIPLTPYVASLLSKLPRENEWVFSSELAKDGRLVEPRIAHNSALKAAGLPHVTLHGLRRSFGTLAEWVEIPTGVVAQIQGHKPSAVAEKHYRRRPLDLLRMWHEKLEAWVLEQAGFPQQDAETEKSRLVADNSKKAIL